MTKGKVRAGWITVSLVSIGFCIPALVQAQSSNQPGDSSARFAPQRVKAAFPKLAFPKVSRGEEAITLLGSKLPEVAAWHGLSASQLTQLLRTDRFARIDRVGRLYYEDPIPTAEAPPAQTFSTATPYAPLAQTFALHSKPGANRVIYLNFVGATLTGTAWNDTQSTIVAPPFNIDGAPSTFTDIERGAIQSIWRSVVEDYAPFDVDITTEPPSNDALTRSSPNDPTFGTTVLITSRTIRPSCICGGVAYINAFDDVNSNFYKPALVFFDALWSDKNIAEATSHEAGHNLALIHDGATGGVEYYEGHGSGPTGWAPIMGVGYSKALVQWSRGEYANANNLQDDFVVMQQTGLPLRADDHTNIFTGATVVSIPADSNTIVASGIIETSSDVDTFRLTAGPGLVRIKVLPEALSPNLDVQAKLYDSSGNLLATSNPVDELGATIQVNLKVSATMYFTIQGTGQGNPLSTGYSSYGSVGQYGIQLKQTSIASLLTPILELLLE